AEATREAFLLLQIAAERQHRNVRRKRERGTEAVDMLIEALCRACVRYARKARQRQRHDERAHGIADRKADVPEQGLVELLQAPRLVLVARRFHLAQHERMATDRSLPEDDEA